MISWNHISQACNCAKDITSLLLFIVMPCTQHSPVQTVQEELIRLFSYYIHVVSYPMYFTVNQSARMPQSKSDFTKNQNDTYCGHSEQGSQWTSFPKLREKNPEVIKTCIIFTFRWIDDKWTCFFFGLHNRKRRRRIFYNIYSYWQYVMSSSQEQPVVIIVISKRKKKVTLQ